MDKDIEKMSEAELKDLRGRIDRALATLDSRKMDEARRAAEEAARQHGFSLADLVAGRAKASKSRSAARYRNPDDASQTWTGRGRQPGWIKEGLSGGKQLSDYAI